MPDTISIYQLLFAYSTYIAIVFILCGWAMLLHVVLKMHRAARSGELTKSDCRKGHLERETGQAFAYKAYLEGKCRETLKTSQKLVQIGILTLVVSLVAGFTVPMTMHAWRKRPIIEGQWPWQGGLNKFMVSALGAAIWVILALYTFSTTVAATIINKEQITVPFIGTALGLLLLLFVYVKYVDNSERFPTPSESPTECNYFAPGTMFLPGKLWVIVLVLGGAVWIASTVYSEKLKNDMDTYVKNLESLQESLNNLDRYSLLVHLWKNYVETSQQVGAPDDPPSQNTIEMLMGDPVKRKEVEDKGEKYIPEAPFYIMHRFGEELLDMEARIMKEYKSTGGTDTTERDIEIGRIKEVRSRLKTLNDTNGEFNAALSISTGGVVGTSVAIVMLPIFLIYKLLAPAVFGV